MNEEIVVNEETLNPKYESFKKIYTRTRQVISNIVYQVVFWGLIVALSTFAYDTVMGSKQGLILGKYKPIYILTGSMEPAIMTNGIIIGESVKLTEDISKVKVGDVVTYTIRDEIQAKDVMITHRIVSIDNEAGTLKTKGDNNGQVDMYDIPFGNVLYKIISIQNWPATVIAIVQNDIKVVVFALMFLIGFGIIFKLINQEIYVEDYEFKSPMRKKKEAKKQAELEEKIKKELGMKPYIGDNYEKELKSNLKEPE